MPENNNTLEFLLKLAPCIERGDLDGWMCGGGGAAGAGDGRGGVAEELNIMIYSVKKYREPQINADKRRFVVPLLSSLVLIETNQKKNHFFPYFAVKNRRLSIILFENHREHRVHREKWQPSEFSVFSVVDCLCKYSIFDHILKRGGIKS